MERLGGALCGAIVLCVVALFLARSPQPRGAAHAALQRGAPELPRSWYGAGQPPSVEELRDLARHEAEDEATWRDVTPPHDVCVCMMTNARYFNQFVVTLSELRSRGEWGGEVVVLPAPDVPEAAMRTVAAAFAPLTVRYETPVNVSRISAWHAEHPFRTTDGRERTKAFQWHKFKFFAAWLPALCRRALFLDAGMHIYQRIQPVLDALEPVVAHRLVAHSDAYQSMHWFDLATQFEEGVCPQCYSQLNATLRGRFVRANYFQTGFMFWDTRIIRPSTFDELVALAHAFPMSRTNEQGILNVWASQRQLWVPLPTHCEPLCLYDIQPRHFHAFPARYVMTKKLPGGYSGPLAALPPQLASSAELLEAVLRVSGVDLAAAAAAASEGASAGEGGAGGGAQPAPLELLEACPATLAARAPASGDGRGAPAMRPLWLVQTSPSPATSLALGFLVHWALSCRIRVSVWHTRGPHHWAVWWRRVAQQRQAAAAVVAAAAARSNASARGDGGGGISDIDAQQQLLLDEEQEGGDEGGASAEPMPGAEADALQLQWYSPRHFERALDAAIAAVDASADRTLPYPSVVYLSLADLPFLHPAPSASAQLSAWARRAGAKAQLLALVHAHADLAPRRLDIARGVPLGGGRARSVRLLPLAAAPARGRAAAPAAMLVPLWLQGSGGGGLPLELPWLALPRRRQQLCFVGGDAFDEAALDQAELAALMRFHARFTFLFLPLQRSDAGGHNDAARVSWADAVRAGGGRPSEHLGAVDPLVSRAASSPAVALLATQQRFVGLRPRLELRGAREQEAAGLVDAVRKCAFVALLAREGAPAIAGALHPAVPLALSLRTPLLLSTAAARAHGFAAGGRGGGGSGGGNSSGGSAARLGGALVVATLAEASRALERVTPEQYAALLRELEQTRVATVHDNWRVLAGAVMGG